MSSTEDTMHGQAQRQVKLRVEQNKDAKSYVENYARRNGWSEMELDEVIGALGVDRRDDARLLEILEMTDSR